MSVIGERSAKLKAAGVLLHQFARMPGNYLRTGMAACGARATDGAEFTTWAKYVTCPACKGLIQDRRASAKARFAATTTGDRP